MNSSSPKMPRSLLELMVIAHADSLSEWQTCEVSGTECEQKIYLEINTLWIECTEQCPMPRALDYRAECLDHAYHPFLQTFREHYVRQGGLGLASS